jgi:hypothetical protein
MFDMYDGVIIVRDKDMPGVDMMVVDGYLCISMSLAQRMLEEEDN